MKDRIYLYKMTTSCGGIIFCLIVEFIIRKITKSTSHAHSSENQIKIHEDEEEIELLRVKPSTDSLKNKLLKPVVSMIILGDTVHNFMDGVAIGSAFCQNFSTGLTLSISVMMEELPHELGDFGILLISGLTVKECLLMNGLSACSSYLGLILGIVIGQSGEGSNFVLAFTGGLFLYISLCEMLPELIEKMTKEKLKIFNCCILITGMVLGTVIVFGVTRGSDFINIY